MKIKESKMVKKIYLTGHYSFGNRGCEAIVRSTVTLLNEYSDNLEFLVPSSDFDNDRKQWPDAHKYNVKFVKPFLPSVARYWVNLQMLPIPLIQKVVWPFKIDEDTKRYIEEADLILSVGGDNYSLDYKVPSPLMALDSYAKKIGKPVIIWGASVGPFDKLPSFIPTIKKHLNNLDVIFVREGISYSYLKDDLNLQTKVYQVADPAFTLIPESIEIDNFKSSGMRNGILGLNISPLIMKYFGDSKVNNEWIYNEIAEFINLVHEKYNLNIILTPHVMPFETSDNNDYDFMKPILKKVKNKDMVSILYKTLNAAQLKFIISKYRFFIGARTHATIAALSSGVPTVSIAYSIKAKGINDAIFKTDKYVLNTPEVNRDSLEQYLIKLFDDEVKIRKILEKEIDKVRQAAHKQAELTVNFLK